MAKTLIRPEMPLTDYDSPCIINWEDRGLPIQQVPVPPHVWKHIREMEEDRLTPRMRIGAPAEGSPTMEQPMATLDLRNAPLTERKLPLEPGAKLFSCPSMPKAAAME